MVQVQLTAQLKVQGGPVLTVGSTLDPESYTYASVVLDATGGPDAEQDIPLLPDEGTVLLLSAQAHLVDGKPATVSLTPKNAGAHPLTVDILAALDPT